MLTWDLFPLAFVRRLDGVINVSPHDCIGMLGIHYADIRLDDDMYYKEWIVFKNVVSGSKGGYSFSIGLSICELPVTILPSVYICVVRERRILRHQVDHWNVWWESRASHNVNSFRQVFRLVEISQTLGLWPLFALSLFSESLDPIICKPASGTPID